MNILFVNNLPFNPSLGGIERVTDTLARELKHRGHKVFFLCNMCPESSIMEYDFVSKQEFLPSGKLEALESDIEFYQQYLIENNIDIVINQRGTYSFGNFVFQKGLSKAKIISVLHTKPLENYSSLRYSIFSTSNELRPRLKNVIKWFIFPILLYKLKYDKISYYKKHYRTLFDYSDNVVLLSKKYLSELELVYSPCLKKIEIIPNINSFSSQSINLSRKKKEILFVGRFTHYDKRIDRLLKIWERISNSNLDWELVLVGDGPEFSNLKCYTNLRRIQNVRFEGFQRNTMEYFKRASIVCLTSSFEGFPLVLTEAMVMGCVPVVFNSFESAGDIIDSGLNGYLIEPFDIKKFASTLDLLMNNDPLRNKIGINAQLKAELFSSTNIATRWELLFNRVLYP